MLILVKRKNTNKQWKIHIYDGQATLCGVYDYGCAGVVQITPKHHKYNSTKATPCKVCRLALPRIKKEAKTYYTKVAKLKI